MQELLFLANHKPGYKPFKKNQLIGFPAQNISKYCGILSLLPTIRQSQNVYQVRVSD